MSVDDGSTNSGKPSNRHNPFSQLPPLGSARVNCEILPAKLRAAERVSGDSNPPMVQWLKLIKPRDTMLGWIGVCFVFLASIFLAVLSGVVYIATSQVISGKNPPPLISLQFFASVIVVSFIIWVIITSKYYNKKISPTLYWKFLRPQGLDFFCPYCKHHVEKDDIWECMNCKNTSIPNITHENTLQYYTSIHQNYRTVPDQHVLKIIAKTQGHILHPYILDGCQNCKQQPTVLLCPHCKMWMRLAATDEHDLYAYYPEHKKYASDLKLKTMEENELVQSVISGVAPEKIRALLPHIPMQGTFEEACYHIDQWGFPEEASKMLKEYVRQLMQYHKRDSQ